MALTQAPGQWPGSKALAPISPKLPARGANWEKSGFVYSG